VNTKVLFHIGINLIPVKQRIVHRVSSRLLCMPHPFILNPGVMQRYWNNAIQKPDALHQTLNYLWASRQRIGTCWYGSLKIGRGWGV